MDPLVSVVIRTYNRENYLREALASVLSQTYTHLEVVVVDVGSTDNTPNLLHSFGNQIRHFRCHSRSHFAAMNFAVEKAEGKYLLLLDDDDTLLPLTAEKTARVVRENPDVSIVMGRWRWILDGENGVVLRETSHIDCNNMFSRLLKSNEVQSCGVLVRKEAILAVGGCDESLSGCVDWDLWLRLAHHGYRFYCLDEFLGIIRVHSGNFQRDQLKLVKGEVEMLEKMSHLLGTKEKRKLYRLNNRLCSAHLAMGAALKESGRTLSALREFFWAMRYRSVRLLWLPLLLIATIALDGKNFRRLRRDVFRREITGDMMRSHF